MGFFLHVREDRNIECEPNFQEPKWLGLSIILDKQMTELRTKHEKGQIFYESGKFLLTNRRTDIQTSKKYMSFFSFTASLPSLHQATGGWGT